MERDSQNLINIEEILEKARQLEETALAILTKEYYPIIFRYFYYRTKTKEDAEDLTSEVFVRLVESIKKQTGNFTAWLFSIARNLLIDYYRKKGRLKEVPLDDTIAQDLKDPSSTKGIDLTQDDLRKLLSHLTDEQREVIILKFIDGYSNDEISQSVKKSVGAIKALQFRALSALRETFKKEA